jgi:outer membrane lipopolysaccharide assembly protein LptE/RlpB
MIALKPKLIVGTVLLTLVAGAAWHYRSVIARNADLVSQVVRLQIANSEIEAALENERRAAQIAIAERRAAQRALDELRAGRVVDTDPEYVEWSQQRIPPSERARICAALPEAEPCEP